MIPSQILQDRYEIGDEVGRGTFGVVYRATDRATGETLAIKVLNSAVRQDAELRHRLKREAELVRRLQSPSAVRIDGLAEDVENLFVVMEFLNGCELSELIARGPLAIEQVDLIARQVLDVLGEAHRLGVLHRDLKPHNLFICRGSENQVLVKVFDFGIAKIVGGESGGLMETTKLTVSGGVLGTPAYMSPEQCRGDVLTPASDLYSLGIVLYEALTGHVPFDDPNLVQLMIMHLERPVPPLPPQVAQTALGRAVIRALEKDPARRFASADEFHAALDEPEPAHSAARIEHQEPEAKLATSASARPRRWPAWAWAAAAAVVIVAAGALAWLV